MAKDETWKVVDWAYDCCGLGIEVLTNCPDKNFAYDGDRVRCIRCKRTGWVSVGLEEAAVIWDNNEEQITIQGLKNKNKVIGIVGSRKRDTQEDLEACRKVFLSIYKEGDKLVSGGCSRGGDRFCEIFAHEYKIPIRIHYADWDNEGRAAGFIRNTLIVEDANVIIAVPQEDRVGGTEDTIRKAGKMNKSVILVGQIPKIRKNSEDELEKFLMK